MPLEELVSKAKNWQGLPKEKGLPSTHRHLPFVELSLTMKSWTIQKNIIAIAQAHTVSTALTLNSLSSTRYHQAPSQSGKETPNNGSTAGTWAGKCDGPSHELTDHHKAPKRVPTQTTPESHNDNHPAMPQLRRTLQELGIS